MAKDVLLAGRDGVDLPTRLDALFTRILVPARPYPLLPVAAADWLQGWANGDERSLRQALAGFLDDRADDQERLGRFCERAKAACRAAGLEWRPRHALAAGSLFNFALAPHSVPVVHAWRYRNVGLALGLPVEQGGSAREHYESSLALARRVEALLREGGTPVRDMLDVQALIFLASLRFDPTTSELRGVEGTRRATASPSGRRPRRGKPYLSLCSCLGYDAPYLVEWLEFHRLVGVERFFLYNNGDREAQRELLEPYVDSALVVLRDWPDFPPQVSAFRDCLQTHADGSRWIAFVDTDEFLFSPAGRPLPDLLSEYEGEPGVGVNMAIFGPSGHDAKPPGLVTESYTRSFGSREIKSIVDPARAVDCMNPHFFTYDSGQTIDENRYPIDGARSTYLSYSRLRINHYFTKSEQEARSKWETARPDTGEARSASFLDMAKYAEERFARRDEAIFRYLPALRAAIATEAARA